MVTTTLSGKGQIVIPKSLRESRRWRPGTQFIVEEITSGILLKTNRTFPLTRPEDGLGCTGYQGPVINVQDMDQAIQGDIRKRARSLKAPVKAL
jgi:AbrB family looped-hinge helix DNA binding protein